MKITKKITSFILNVKNKLLHSNLYPDKEEEIDINEEKEMDINVKDLLDDACADFWAAVITKMDVDFLIRV